MSDAEPEGGSVGDGVGDGVELSAPWVLDAAGELERDGVGSTSGVVGDGDGDEDGVVTSSEGDEVGQTRTSN